MDEAAVSFSPNEGRKVSVVDGATRTFCPDCGSSLTGRYAYLPDQVYISLGVIDQAGELVPELHVHEDSRLSWLHIQDDLERMAKSGRAKIGSI
jgi:hypothetical protein